MAFDRHFCSHSKGVSNSNVKPNWPMMKDGRMFGGEGLTADQQNTADGLFQDQYLTLEKLLGIADCYDVLPSSTMQNILDESVKHAGSGVARNIFDNGEKSAYWGGKSFNQLRDDLAVALISKSMTKVNQFNFNNVTKREESEATWKNLIHGEDGGEMGRGLLVEDMFQRGFDVYYKDKQEWLPKLETFLMDEVYIIGTVIKQLTSQTQLPAKMKFFMLQAMGSSKIDQIEKKWTECSSEAFMKPVKAFVTTDNHLDFVSGWLNSDPYFPEVQTACTKHLEETEKNYHEVYNNPPAPTSLKACYHTINTYGKKVEEWSSSSSGPIRLSLTTGERVSGNKSEYCPYSDSQGCFLAGTLVLLDQNTDVSIEHLQENDKIVGWHGNIGVVSSEKVEVKLEKETAAFGFNDDDPFFLACHPFWTQDGWRAINPVAAKEENKWLDVGHLTPGDYVRQIKKINDGNIEYEWIKIQKINLKTYPAGTKFFGVHTREGPRSYHANGYLVCQNYPEITIQSIVDGLQNVSLQEQKSVQEQLKKLEPSLTKIMGTGPAKAILALSKKRVDHKLAKPKPRKVHYQDLTFPRIKFAYGTGVKMVGNHTWPNNMALLKGHLFLDGQYVPVKTFADKQHILWTRRITGGLWEHGCIKMFGNKFLGKGYICVTKGRNDSEFLSSSSFAVGPNINTYNCFRGPIQNDPDNKVNKQSEDWTETGVLEMGTEGMTLIAKISVLPKMPVPDPLDNSVQFSVDEHYKLIVNVDVPQIYQSFLTYTKFYGVFNWDYTSFFGYCTEYDGFSPGGKGDSYDWKGEIDSANDSQKLLDIARKDCLKRSLHDKKQTAEYTSPARMAYLMMNKANDDLSIEELFLLTTPDPQEMHDRTFELLQKVMKYDMDEDLLNDVLGTVKPTLNTIEQECANAYPEFFGYRFANAYLMNALSQDSSLEDEFTETQRNRLLYYWAGNEEGCLSQDPDYNQANNRLGRLAYLETLTRLQDYLNSSKGGDAWAQELYDYISTDQMLTTFATIVVVDQDMSVIQKQSMVLYCLSPEGHPDSPDQNYAADFYCTVLTKRLGINSDYFDGKEDAEEIMIEIMGDLIHEFVIQVLNGGDEFTQEIIAEYRTQMEEIADELNLNLLENFEDVITHLSDFATDVIGIYLNDESGANWDKFFPSVNEWFDEHPELKKCFKGISSALSFAFWGLALAGSAMAFMSWDTIPPEAKASVILDTVTMGLKAFAKVGPKMITLFDKACMEGMQTLDWIKSFSQAKSDNCIVTGYRKLVTEGSSAVEGAELSANEAFGKAVAKSKGDISKMTGKWGKLFNGAEKLAKVTGVLASAAGCIMMGFQIYKDFVSGASVAQKVLDIIQGVSFAVVTICGAVHLFIEISVVPVIGDIAAVVGIIAAIVLLFIHKDPPDTRPPSVKYIEDVGSVYVDNELKEPTQEWLDEFNEAHPPEE